MSLALRGGSKLVLVAVAFATGELKEKILVVSRFA
jgi:hypothetical protein